MLGKTLQCTAGVYDYPLLIKHLLHTPLASAPGRQIVYRDLMRYDYRTLRERLGRLASALAGIGVKPGATVAVMDWDSHRYLECFFAVPMMGAVLQTVNIRLTPEQILYTLNHAGADVLLVNADFLPLLQQIRSRLQAVRELVLLSDTAQPPQTGLGFAGAYEDMLAAASPDFDFPDFDENTRATTFYTTGTTGSPKGVYFSHRQLVLHTLAGAAALGMAARGQRFHRDDVYMPLTPMFHVHAWGVPYTATLMGVKQVYPGRYAIDVLLGLIRDEKVTFSHCVPALLHGLLSCPASREIDLSHWKVAVGGSSLPEGLMAAALARGVDVFAGYGMSETCPVLTLAQPGEGNDELRASAGRPIPMVDLRIVDEAMNELPRDGKAVGEIVVRAPWLTAGYLHDPENSRHLWRGGYLHTGDLATVDGDGYVRIVDRMKDVIKSGGEWISSLELESLISRHEAVSEVAVIAITDEKWGERPLPLVVLKPGARAENAASAILAHLAVCATNGAISKWALPHRVVIVDELPRTGVGKLDKKVLRGLHGNSSGEPETHGAGGGA